MLLLCGALLLSACAVQQAAGPEQKDPYQSGELYYPSQDAMADVEATIDKARVEDKLALVVLGANWCHDSRALAARMYQAPLSEVMGQYYETVFVDVGYLDTNRELARALGIPAYYATPTVLIIDPQTGAVINDRDRHQWGAAERISMEDSVDYFQRMGQAGKAAPDQAVTGELARLYAAIDGYERLMAQKVEVGYDRVGPMLEAYKNHGKAPAEFEHDWEEVSEFRKSVPSVIASLRDEARQRVKAGETGVELAFPPLTVYSWE
jgi:hypothetical protein